MDFSLANNRLFLQRDTDRIRLWFPCFTYFEENVQTAIPNEYSLPKSLTLFYTSWEIHRYSPLWIVLFLLLLIVFIVFYN